MNIKESNATWDIIIKHDEVIKCNEIIIFVCFFFPAALRPVASKDEGELESELRRGLEEALEGLEVDGGAHVARVEQAEGGREREHSRR